MRTLKPSDGARQATFEPGRLLRLAIICSFLILVAPQVGEAEKLSSSGWGSFIVTTPPVVAPDTLFYDSAGAQRRISEFRGRVVLVNLWATWCAACIVEMPELDRLQSMIGVDRLAVLAISQESGSAQAIADFYAARNIGALKIYIDHEQELGRALGQTLLPTSVLIDPNGVEVGRLVGAYAWSSPKSVERIVRLLAHHRSVENP